VAALLGARPAEIVFTSGATESNHTAILGALQLHPGKRHIVTSAVEHPSTLRLLAWLERQGVCVTYLPVDAQGRLDPAKIADAITPRTALLSLMWANNETGALFPIAEAGAIAAARGLPFHCDAVQAVGRLEFEFARLPIDLMSVSAHKLHGPPGVGALAVRKSFALPPLLHGHQERNRRGGTENLPGIVGFGIAAEALATQGRTWAADVSRLRNHFERELQRRLPTAQINAMAAARVGNTSNFRIGTLPSELVLQQLEQKGVCASSGSACTAGGTDPSHVLTAMGQDPSVALAALRFSFGHDNTLAEIAEVLDLLTSILVSAPGIEAAAA
jgi:cysteine desulfurase